MEYQHEQATSATGNTQAQSHEGEQPFVRGGRKVGRNEQCPCGSGEKNSSIVTASCNKQSLLRVPPSVQDGVEVTPQSPKGQ